MDKQLARKKKRRISENNLLLCTALGGFLGGVFAMYFFRHKIKKFAFMWRFVLLVAIWIVALWTFFRW